MKIQVTQQHIDKGVRGSCSSDPICLAMKDAGFFRPWVSPDRIKTVGFNGGYMCEEFAVPESVLDFMRLYDNNLRVQPFEFSLEGI